MDTKISLACGCFSTWSTTAASSSTFISTSLALANVSSKELVTATGLSYRSTWLGGVAINWFYLQNYWRNTSILSSVIGNHFTKYVWDKYKPLTTNCARTQRQFTWTQSCVQLQKEWLAGLLHARQHPLNDRTGRVEIQHRTVTGLPKGKRSSVLSTTLPSLYFETLQSNSSY